MGLVHSELAASVGVGPSPSAGDVQQCQVVEVAGQRGLDQEVVALLRRSAKPVVVAANKVEGPAQEAALAEVHALGLPVFPVSAEHGRGVAELLEGLRDRLPGGPPAAAPAPARVRLAVVGRPNVGKSSLVNAIVGEERVLVHHERADARPEPL